MAAHPKQQVVPRAAIPSEELMQAQAEIWCLSSAYVKSMARRCAVKLGIPDAIHRSGGAATLPGLLAALSIPEARLPHLSRLMRLLATLGIFTEAKEGRGGGVCYRLTPASLLLVHDDAGANGGACLSEYVASATALSDSLMAYLRLDEWFRSDDVSAAAGGSPAFVMAYGMDYWAAAGRDAERSASFCELMGSDSRLVAQVVLRECGGEVFGAAAAMVDVGGGDGTMARAVKRAFPHVRCSVLELPHVVESIRAAAAGGCDDGAVEVEFVAGDMMDFIPAADVVLLKYVLHDWSDEDCVRILRRCREAITTSANGPEGKVVIIDMVVGGSASSTTKEALEAQLFMDMCMMVLATGKERDEETWSSIFMDAGFTHYKIRPVLGLRSVIEVYP
ncbi:unnamed protein product [Urochloa decumbens]|uniref:Uncharacterized protein n=1 Tax=Urochloa decumbens TaxID=240449 RepID=A0ABC9B5R4_9POAL